MKIQLGDKEDWVTVERTKCHAGATEVKPASPPVRGQPKRAGDTVNPEDSAISGDLFQVPDWGKSLRGAV